jgi:hypothetical protein
MFSAEFSSGEYGGSSSNTMLSGMFNFFDLCHPARSTIRTAIAPGLTHLLIPAKCKFMMSVLTVGMIKALPIPRAGQIAPNRYTQLKRRSRNARGRVPRRAHMRVNVPC